MSAPIKSLFQQHIQSVSQRSSAAMGDCGFDRLVIAAGNLEYRFLDDREIPFVANPHFKWWVPVVDNPKCVLEFRPGEKPLLHYSIPKDYWYKPAAEPSDFWTDAFEIEIFSDPKEMSQRLLGQPVVGQRTAFIGDPSVHALADRAGWAINPERLISRLHWDRAQKTNYEVECVAEANRVAAKGHQAAEQSWRAGGSEYDIHLAYLAATAHTDDELPYHSIVATGRNGAVLHYQHRDRVRGSEAELAYLLDAGASTRGYASDITRTATGQPGPFADLIQAMDQSQQVLADAVVPGLAYPELHIQAHSALANILVDAGIARCQSQQLLDEGLTSAFFPHGLGHFLGLQVHDVGGHQAAPEGGQAPAPADHPFLRLTRTLESGHIVTIEPGVYFIPMLLDPLRKTHAQSFDWSLIDSLIPFGGVRIEDNVLATPEGPRNLTREAFAIQ